MFRIIFGFTLSTICGLSICVAFISFAGDNINQSQLGGMILGSLVLSIPGWLLCYSGGQSLKSKKVLKTSLNMLQDDNAINVDKISSLTGRNKSKAIKDIERGQKKGIIPNDIEIIISSKIAEDKYLSQDYISSNNSNNTHVSFEERKAKAKQGFKESIQSKKIVINFCSNFIPLFVAGVIFIISLIFYADGIGEWFFLTIVTFGFSILIAIIITILNILDASVIRLLPLPMNRFTKHLLTYSFMLLIAPIAFIPFVLANIFVKRCIKNYYNSTMKLQTEKVIFVVKQTFRELVNEVFNKEQIKRTSKD